MKSPEGAGSPNSSTTTSQASPAVATSTHPEKRSKAKKLAYKILGGCVMSSSKMDSAVTVPSSVPPTLLTSRQRECPASLFDNPQPEKSASNKAKFSMVSDAFDEARVDEEDLRNNSEIGNLLGNSCHPISTSRNLPWDDVEAERDWCTQDQALTSKNLSCTNTREPSSDSDTQDISSKYILEQICALNKLGATVMIPASAFPDRVPGALNGPPLEFRPSLTPIATLEGEDPFSFSSTLVRHVQQCAGVRHV